MADQHPQHAARMKENIRAGQQSQALKPPGKERLDQLVELNERIVLQNDELLKFAKLKRGPSRVFKVLGILVGLLLIFIAFTDMFAAFNRDSIEASQQPIFIFQQGVLLLRALFTLVAGFGIILSVKG